MIGAQSLIVCAMLAFQSTPTTPAGQVLAITLPAYPGPGLPSSVALVIESSNAWRLSSENRGNTAGAAAYQDLHTLVEVSREPNFATLLTSSTVQAADVNVSLPAFDGINDYAGASGQVIVTDTLLATLRVPLPRRSATATQTFFVRTNATARAVGGWFTMTHEPFADVTLRLAFDGAP